MKLKSISWLFWLITFYQGIAGGKSMASFLDAMILKIRERIANAEDRIRTA